MVTSVGTKEKKEKKERKKDVKKKNKKRKKSNDDNVHMPIDPITPLDSEKEEGKVDKIPKMKAKKNVKSSLKSRKEEKEELMKKIPMKNEDGIAFTKFQIRQMMKRVKKGLPPVATPQELEEKRRNESRLRREEEAELAGLASTRNSQDSDEEKDSHFKKENDNGGNNRNTDDDIGHDVEENSHASSSDTCKPVPSAMNNVDTAKKKTKRNKLIPSDYICQACKNRHTPAHWIYDCPDKVTVRGTNKKKKRERGINDPDSKKVFVSGLPFDVKPKAVEDFFSVTNNCGTIAFVRLVKFHDTNRCNGQAYISFDTDEGANRAIKLSGTSLDAEALSGDNDSKKKMKEENPARRKELRLKVSKVLNRRKTKRS